MRETRLITRATRPHLYEQLEWQAANDDSPLPFDDVRWHPFLEFCAWCAESNWRMLALVGTLFLIGEAICSVLP